MQPEALAEFAVEVLSSPVTMQSLGSTQRPQTRHPSSEDWSRLRPEVTELYVDQRYTLDQVRDHLVTMGYRVNKRMVRGRITKWNLQRNHQLRDMIAALRLLGPDRGSWPSPVPRFLIRGRIVTMNEIEAYFQRKKIRDPVQWVHYTVMDGEEEQDVILLNDDTMVGRSEVVVAASSGQLPASQHLSLTQRVITLNEQILANLQEYCSSYIRSGDIVHQEPQVHQFTIHGQFGEFIRDGLAHMMRKTPDAFPNFQRGFDLVHSLLSDFHPMALSQYLSVLCLLATNQAQSVLISLSRHVGMMASTLRMPTHVANVLNALQSSQDVLHTAIVCLRATVGTFNRSNSMFWKRFYIQERLCDCLYYGNARSEGSASRGGLFLDQEAFYGPCARNVICTLMNVAADFVDQGEIDRGEAHFEQALTRSEQLAGLGRAKVRFTALEGLAQCEQIRFENNRHSPINVDQVPTNQHLYNAYRSIDEALGEALAWFPPSSRRTLRAIERRTYITKLLSENNQGSPSNSFLGWIDVAGNAEFGRTSPKIEDDVL